MTQTPELVWTCCKGFFSCQKKKKKKVMGFVWVSRVYTWSEVILPEKVLVVLPQLAKPVSSLVLSCILPAPDVHDHCAWSSVFAFTEAMGPCPLIFFLIAHCSWAVLLQWFSSGLKLEKGQAFKKKKIFFLLVCSDSAHSWSQVWAWGGDASWGHGGQGATLPFSASVSP